MLNLNAHALKLTATANGAKMAIGLLSILQSKHLKSAKATTEIVSSTSSRFLSLQELSGTCKLNREDLLTIGEDQQRAVTSKTELGMQCLCIPSNENGPTCKYYIKEM